MKPSSMVPFTKPMAAIVRLLIFAARTIPATWADQRPAHEAPREPEGPQRSAGLEAARLFESEAAARSQRSRRGHNRAADGYAGAAPVQVKSPVAEIGRAWGRGKVGPYVEVSGGAGYIKKTNNKKQTLK